MKGFIITGTSRGLGEALATRVIGPENAVFCIARNENRLLKELVQERGGYLQQIIFDLNFVEGIADMIQRIFDQVSLSSMEGFYLINNAGVLEPVKPLERCEGHEIVRNLTINAASPMALTASFILALNDFDGDKRVINISSGAGRKPYDGWSCYSSSKAALDMFTRCVAMEQERREHPVKILSFAPGIVDTAMQGIIRSTPEEDFPQLKRFIAFKDEGKLRSTEFVAEKAIELLWDDTIPSGSLLDISERLSLD